MDLQQYKDAIEAALYLILNQGPDAIEHLQWLLVAIKAGIVSILGVSQLIAQWPVLVEAINQLVILINSGATIAEIASQLAAWAMAAHISIDAVLQLLYALAGFLALF